MLMLIEAGDYACVSGAALFGDYKSLYKTLCWSFHLYLSVHISAGRLNSFILRSSQRATNNIKTVNQNKYKHYL